MNKLQQITINYLITFGFFVFLQGLSAQKVDKFYVNMPDALNPTLSKQNRLELLEYHKAGSGDSITNRFGNLTNLISLDTLNNHLVIKNTESSTFEMKVLNLNDSIKSIGIIRTVCGSICHSSVEFYDTAWNLISLQFIMPKAVDWLNEETYSKATIDKMWVENALETNFISLSFDKVQQILIAKNNSLDFLSEIDRKIILPFVIDKVLIYRLKDRTWVLQP